MPTGWGQTMNEPMPLASVLTSIDQAHGLPNAHYTDPSVFNEEKHAVLFANWAGVGFGIDVPNVGDAKPIDFLGMPLLLVRDNDGSIIVFQNTCRHRGMILVQTPTTIRTVIRCPYHSWCYSLKGELRATPHVGGPGKNTHPSIVRDELSLARVRSTVWHDIVFVNIDGLAPEFEIVHRDLIARWAAFDQPMVHGGAPASVRLEVKTNWKLAVENYCESYHLPWVHPGLNTYSRLEDHYMIDSSTPFSGQGTLVYQQLKSDEGETLTDFDGLSAHWDAGAEYISLYPNVLLGVHRDHFFAIVLEPLSTDYTVERLEIYYAESAQCSPAIQALGARNAALWQTVFAEDIFVVEGMQRGRHGVLFDGGRFSPAMDGPTHHFHQWVATQIEHRRPI